MGPPLKKILSFMPVFFGVGFIAPLIAQTMAAWKWPAPFGLSQVAFGLVLGVTWGVYAKWRGRWI
jgi:hypothetical protein